MGCPSSGYCGPVEVHLVLGQQAHSRRLDSQHFQQSVGQGLQNAFWGTCELLDELAQSPIFGRVIGLPSRATPKFFGAEDLLKRSDTFFGMLTGPGSGQNNA